MAYGNRKQTINKVHNGTLQGYLNCAQIFPENATEKGKYVAGNVELDNKLPSRKCNQGSQSDGKGFLSNGTDS